MKFAFLFILLFLPNFAEAKSKCEETFSASLQEPPDAPWVKNWRFEKLFTETAEIILPSFKNFTNAEEVSGGREHSQPVVRSIADFDNDGFDDFLVTFHETKRQASIIFSVGDGTLELVDLPDSTSSRLLRETSLADFNNDGLMDIYGHTAPHDWRGKLGTESEEYGMDEPDFLLLNLGNREFRTIDVSSLTNSNNHQGAVADFNNDGFVDVFSQPQKSEKKRYVLYNRDGFNFARGNEAFRGDFAQLQYWDAEAADLNTDGYQDLILSIQHFKSDPDYLEKNGSLVLVLNDSGSIENGKKVRFGDFWTTKAEWANFISFLSCLSEAGQTELVGTTAFSAELKLYDFNDDGFVDIVVNQMASGHFKRRTKDVRGAVEFGSFIRFFQNDGNGNYEDSTASVMPYQALGKIFMKPVGRPIAIHFADISGDGTDDLILQNIGSRYRELGWKQYPYIFISDGDIYMPVNKQLVGDLYWKDQLFPADLNGDGNMDLVAMRFDKKKSRRYKFITYVSKN